MAFYESIFIARQELGEKEIEKTIESFKGILEKNSADLVDTELWGLRNLAYKV
jgi:small subunit ribosomal protein S6